MHLDIKEELLFAMLFFGFRRLLASLTVADNIAFPSPKAGAEPTESAPLALPVISVPASLLGAANSADGRPSFGCSCMLLCTSPDFTLLFVSNL